ncbi:mucin-5AC isoform X2 [Pectinophora gossypiella]|uniref:mucin-5AC isoform X2 n=1 Tax=Pectinophora gossypiella TaxID=13191 RepID=UPI00214E51DE|nr:mucin-5AC isoform X2 [Pectinophora gossypiella]
MHLKTVLPLFVFTCGLLYSVEGQSVVCPAVRTTSGWLDLFPLPCRKHAECRVMGTQHLCCKGYCTKGIKPAPIRTDQQKSSVTEASSTSTSTSSTTTSTSTTTTTTTTTTTPSTTSSTTTTTTTTQRPTEPPRPFLQILPIIQSTQATQAQRNAPAKTGKSQKLVCPKPGSAPVLLFPIPCENNAQCRVTSGPDQVCCERRCVKGVPAPRPTSKPRSHQPLLGVIPRECPTAPLGELLFEVQSCKTDADCWPRVCCPDGTRSYCRTARARLDLVPIANQIDGPVRMFEQYLQCTKPPQYDLFPQKCSSSVDCFPNLCCAEGGNKHCRPPQRSLLALLAGVTQRVGSTLSNLRQSQAANSNKA